MTTKENQRADLLLLLFSVFATASANSVVFASMSELQEQYKYADSALGLIAGTGFAMGLLVQLFVAPLADRGHGKKLIQVGLGLAALGSVIFALGDSLTVFIVGRGIVGASIGLTFPAVRALAAHLDESRSAERLGAVAGMEIGGFVSGPLIGSLIIGPFGLDATFLLFGALAVMALFVISPRGFPELVSTTESQRLSFDLLRIRSVRVALILTLAVTFPTGMFDALWDRFLDDLGGNNAMTGLTFAVYGLPFILFSARAGKLIDKRSPIAVVLWLVIPISLLTISYGLIKNPWVILGVGLFEGIAQAAVIPAALSAIAKAAPLGRASAAQGLSGAVNVFGQMVAAFIAPTIYGAYGAFTTFFVVAVGIAIIASAAGIMHLRNLKSSR
ncbi:MAG: MFS transporter [Actinobacteria bacterium]|nr:MFS transporter [Actinomycetota bacterium]NDF66905.1 MFS transporter [Actinomycetota bacterium]